MGQSRLSHRASALTALAMPTQQALSPIPRLWSVKQRGLILPSFVHFWHFQAEPNCSFISRGKQLSRPKYSSFKKFLLKADYILRFAKQTLLIQICFPIYSGLVYLESPMCDSPEAHTCIGITENISCCTFSNCFNKRSHFSGTQSTI